jgi:hypothetical protein
MKEITNEPFVLSMRNFIRIQIINLFAKYCNNYFKALTTATFRALKNCWPNHTDRKSHGKQEP